MKRISSLAAGVVFALIASAVAARAEVSIKGIQWRFPETQGQKTVYADAQRWSQPPASRLNAKPRAIVTLINRGPNPAEGVLLRYVVSARLVKRTQGAAAARPDAGVWTVPFWMEERRVPWLKPNEAKEIPVDNMLLATYFKKLFRTGYWPNAIRIRVMVEARPGQDLEEPVEQALPIVWEGKGQP